MEDSDIIALYFACAESAVSETVKKYGAYLNAVAYNILRSRACDRLDYITAKCRAPDAAVRLEELAECVPDSRGSAEDAWETRRTAAAIDAFLAALDRRDCAVFVSRYYYGRSARETASRLGLTERQVKYRLARTRASLKNYLETEGVEL